ncbi:MAG TPA: sigma 54-interacting transcriptional regulator, partial [Bacteroidales bacterium]|nr:sigma 54-interacting transcriptional regulator [Bacteroidales bacterium]
TDAKGERAGRFERADKGTIFLDEIGDLSHSSQVKLLRVLQDQTFEKLGDSKSMTVDVRILSATNKDLASLVAAGSFREDLLYRINLIHIEVPPLRKRKNDVPVLADYFAGKAARIYSMDNREISQDGKDWLTNREWPGNIRELKNLVERTVLLTTGETIKAADLIMAAGKNVNTEKQNSSKGTLDDMERSMIVRLIEECGGNLSKASEKLGISRTTLYRKMDKYNIQADSDE